MNNLAETNAYRRLAAAILLRAADDFVCCNLLELIEVLEFFRGKWYVLLAEYLGYEPIEFIQAMKISRREFMDSNPEKLDYRLWLRQR